jgi:hypothetical protein
MPAAVCSTGGTSVAAERTEHVARGAARGKGQNVLAVQCQASEQLVRENEKDRLYQKGLLVEFVLEHVTYIIIISSSIMFLKG